MLKVLCFGRFFDDIPGGMQTHVDHLFKALEAQVQYVHLVPSRTAQSSQDVLHGAPLVRTASWNVDGSLALSPGLIWKARQLHQQRQFDVVHLHFPDPMSHIASLAIPASVPRVISWHADIIRQKTMLRLYKPMLERIVQQARAIVVATPSHISSSPVLSAIKDTQRLHVIPYGFDLASHQQAHSLAPELCQRYPGKIIFALGRHVHYKGFDILIQAIDKLPADTQLVIGGEGPLTNAWKKLASESAAHGRIHFAGLIPHSDLPAYYQACDIFCLPAVNQAEAFGIVQVEAMACAKPVVSTKLNNGVDFVNQDGVSGFTVEPSNVAALAHALNALLADDALRLRLGQQALQRAVEEFSLEALRSKTLRVYQEAVLR